MTNKEMRDKKMNIRGYVKKGMIFCTIGVLAMGMVACSSGKKSSSSGTKAKSQTESTKSNDSKSSSRFPAARASTGSTHQQKQLGFRFQ